MPLIAIVPCSKLSDYEISVRTAGGEPWILERTTHRPADVVADAEGLLLTGGGDVHPSLYGETMHSTFDAAEPGRDQYEIELVRLALDADLPIFAICRGLQVLNVARGGRLVQDIPSQISAAVSHTMAHQPFELAHEVRIEKDSRLAMLMKGGLLEGTDGCKVNSRHHQAPRTIGEGLLTTATAPDGVIEAIEEPTRRFCLGVQWHPENFYRTGEFGSLFEGFVRACKS